MACETDTAEAILGLNVESDHQSFVIFFLNYRRHT